MNGSRHRLDVACVLVVAAFLVSAAAGCYSRPAAVEPTSAPTAVPSPTPEAVPSFSHVFVILMENRSYSQVIGSADAPYVNELARTYGLATSYYGVRHPSLPNYLALVSGSTQGTTDSCDNCSFEARTLADQLEEHNKSWKAYVEDLPSPCFDKQFGSENGPTGNPLYARKHNPWMYFKGISDSPERCGRDVPLSQFEPDLKQNRLPDFVWITPNMVHTMHDGSVKDGDTWLASFLPQIIASDAWKNNGVIFLLWDEGADSDNGGWGGLASGGHVPALVITPSGKPGFQSDRPYTHYSLLRTIEDAWNLGTLGHSGDPGISPMIDFFRKP